MKKYCWYSILKIGKKIKQKDGLRQVNKNKKLWIAWQKHRRTLELNKILCFDLVIYESKLPRILNHPFFLFKSWLLIHFSRPKLLLVQNPSIFLTVLACFLKYLYDYKLIVDAHNAGLSPPMPFLNRLYAFMQKRANLTIVTNEGLAEIVKSNKGLPFILPDKIPQELLIEKISFKSVKALMYICTFGSDEPWEEVINAAKKFDNNTLFYITGDFKKVKSLTKKSPSNVIFTGFLPDKEYWGLLCSVNLAIDLTLRENCLVCGAYEALAVGTPAILSDTKALKNYFYKGFVFSRNDKESLISKIREALEMENTLRKEIVELKKELNLSWEEKRSMILQIINNLMNS